MFFLPYKLDLSLRGIPLLTWAVLIACVMMFLHQEYTRQVYVTEVHHYCDEQVSPSVRSLLDIDELDLSCATFVDGLKFSAQEPETYVSGYVEEHALELTEGDLVLLSQAARSAESSIESHATQEWVYLSDDVSPFRMFASAFSHADFEHLVFNLLFFFIYAAAVELAVGHLAFLLIFAAACISTALAYSVGLFGVDNSLPSLGLSGVVMAFMAAAGLLFPHRLVRVFYWVVVRMGVVRAPLLLVAAVYVGMDLYGLRWLQQESNIGYLSHVIGAVTGAAVGLVYLLFARDRLRQEF